MAACHTWCPLWRPILTETGRCAADRPDAFERVTGVSECSLSDETLAMLPTTHPSDTTANRRGFSC